MRLILTLSGNGVPEKDKVRTLSTGSITIGRAAGNDWVLPDPDRSLSKSHCSIMERNGRFILTDTSTNGIFLNGAAQATERDSQTVLNHGDKLVLGDYAIIVSASDDADMGMGYQPAMPTGNSFSGLGGAVMPRGPLDMDALDDPLGRPGAPGFSQNPGFSQPAYSQPTDFSHPMAPVDVQPRGLDPFDNMQSRSGHAGGIGPDEDMFRGVAQSNDWQGASRPDHTPVISTAVPAMRVSSPQMGGDIDFDALIGDLPGANPNRGPAQPAARAPDPFAPNPSTPPGGDPFGAAPPQPGANFGAFPAAVPGAGHAGAGHAGAGHAGAGYNPGGPPPGFNAADLMADLAMPGQPDPFAAQGAGAGGPSVGQPTGFAPVPSPAGGAANPAFPNGGLPAPTALNPGHPGAAMPQAAPAMPPPMVPGMVPPHQLQGVPPQGAPIADPFAAPNAGHPGAGLPTGFPAQPPVSPLGGWETAAFQPAPTGADAIPAPVPPPFNPTPVPQATPLGANNPFEESAGRHVADDAEFDPLAVTTRQPAASAPAVASPQMPAPLTAASAQGAAPPQTMPAGAPASTDARAAFHAFLEGAGIAEAKMDDSNPEAALRAAGEVFKAMTEGLREVLISRAAIKSEMRIEATMISAGGNNALKFSVAPEDAVVAMLTPKRRGYMAPLAAAREAVADIKDHEIAVMAGVQTALMHLLKRFDPDELEKRLNIGGLSAVLPGARKSRYWDSFRQIYGDITREAEDDFQAVFGRNFAKAYTEQSRKE
jgi:type VI secretion system FHA domain protein